MNEELDLQEVDVTHLVKSFIIGVLGTKVEGNDEPEFIHTYTPTPEQLKKNPDNKGGQYMQIEVTAKPKAGEKFASRTRKAAVKQELINAGTPEYIYYASQLEAKKGAILPISANTDKPVFVLNEEVDYILKRYSCKPSRIQLKNGLFMKSPYTVVTDGKKDTELKDTVVTNFSMLFLPSDFADVNLRNELIDKERTKTELFPAPVVTSAPAQPNVPAAKVAEVAEANAAETIPAAAPVGTVGNSPV